jgi:acetoin utilization protein AcuC
VARAWTQAWALINDVALPDALPRRAHEEMTRFGLESLTLSDPPAELPADTRRWAKEYAARQIAAVHEKIFPLHGL